MQGLGIIFLSVMCVCTVAGTLSAQEAINYGTISGQVTDPQGAVVPGASVTAGRSTQISLARRSPTRRDVSAFPI